MTDEVEDFFAKPQGAPSYKFGDVGSGLRGTVVSTQMMDQTDFADRDKVLKDRHGNTKRQLQVILQTELRDFANTTDKAKLDQDGNKRPLSEDDGKRAIYVKNQMTDAIRDELAKSGKTKLEVGGELAVKLTGHKDVGKGNPLSLYEARYTPPAASSGDFFEEGQDSTPAAPAPETAAAADNDEPPF